MIGVTFDYDNLWYLLYLRYLFVNSEDITIQSTYKSIKFQEKIIGVRALLACFRNRYQVFPRHSITFWGGDWKGDQIFRLNRSLGFLMRKK